MSIYKIADLFINIECKSEYAKNLLKDYLSAAKAYDLTLEITAEDIKYEETTAPGYSLGMYESTAVLRKLSNAMLLNYNGALIHCAVISYNGKAYAFTAPSGTGKTTHIKIWQKCLCDRVKIINGDKPFIRYINGEPIAFGTPWQGKENLGSNIACPLDGIFILKRGTANSVKIAKPNSAVFSLINSVACPQNQRGKIKAFEFLDRLSCDVKIFELSCNKEDDACYTALKAIEGELNEN